MAPLSLTDRLAVTMQIAQRVYALARKQNNPALLVSAYRALASTLYHLGEFEAARRHARRGVQLWRSSYVPAPVEEVHAPAVVCLCYEALADWHFGKTASWRAAMAEAISVATALERYARIGAGEFFMPRPLATLIVILWRLNA